MRPAHISLMVISGLVSAVHLTNVIAAEDSPVVIEPHVETQGLMSELLRPSPMANEAELRRKLELLSTLARANGPRFVQQVVLHEVQLKTNGAEVGPYMFLREANISKSHYAEGLGVLLYCRDKQIRRYAWELFPLAIGRVCNYGHADLSHIRDHVTGNYQKSEISTPLKRAIFESAPNAAFLLYHTEAKGIEMLKFRRAERAISNAMFEREMIKQERDYLEFAKHRGLPGRDVQLPAPWKLDPATAAVIHELATSKHWWARMFIAEIMVQNKDFRDVELLKTLAEDENELVRQSVASINAPDPLRAGKVDR